MDDDLRSVTTSSVTSQSLFQRVQLDSMERDWFRFAALGNAAALGQLLKQDPTLASKRTARHWAAKHGRLEMAEMIAKAGVGVSIKTRSMA
ncbi:ankyrin repeat domain-containing protein SOWAHC-like [Acipenser ruthenus]|uniref:ankyrin repeat domain-containing protein SOWAHC-like n=1 Tax=Acipenser ruthenus TaxID=7906 RepID=UPI0027412B3A|nr:ankyrin repeat domain-containing protein SOWAHC-like [Acipenser ruthenus]XP_058849910.1 ankyrin repeat domain-containing protein SOWAHC-like [Acipenser ruthenus]